MVAEKLGWTLTRASDGEYQLRNPVGKVVHATFEYNTKIEHLAYLFIAYDTDANTRQEMLAVMTREQKIALVTLARIEYKGENWTVIDAVFILELTQPSFFNLWGKAMGLWE